jgi:hypothetical protein
MAFTLETGVSDRASNMEAFARAALELLSRALGDEGVKWLQSDAWCPVSL